MIEYSEKIVIIDWTEQNKKQKKDLSDPNSICLKLDIEEYWKDIDIFNIVGVCLEKASSIEAPGLHRSVKDHTHTMGIAVTAILGLLVVGLILAYFRFLHRNL